jgi:Cof subfamily protein (haloacid dehalogenase superfamily)
MSKYGKYIIISDLDGTLINSQHEISQKNLAAIDYFTEQGGRFAIATGRSIQNVRPFITGLKLNGPSILYNGAAVYDFSSEIILGAEYLEKDLLTDYINYCINIFDKMVVEIFTPEGMYIVSPESNVDDYVLLEKQPFSRAELKDLMERDWLKLMLYDKHNTLIEAQKAFFETKLDSSFCNFFSHEFYFEVLNKGTSKGSALKSLRKLEHFSDKTIIAVGDYDNDIEMVKFADVGIAVENAREGVRSAADIVTVSNDCDAIHEIIYNIIPTL